MHWVVHHWSCSVQWWPKRHTGCLMSMRWAIGKLCPPETTPELACHVMSKDKIIPRTSCGYPWWYHLSWKTKIHDAPMKDECYYLVVAVLLTCLLDDMNTVLLTCLDYSIGMIRIGSSTGDPPVTPLGTTKNDDWWTAWEFDPHQTPSDYCTDKH